jgi:uncharacterized membrane protein YfcA
LEILHVFFPVSGVETYIFIPPLVAFIISFFTSMGGLSGAFLLLPFQMSFLNFTSPAVSSTNFLFNIIAIPSGVYRYIREGRMAWPLTFIVATGTLPGVLIGYYMRVLYFPDPRAFKFFVGLVLLYLAIRLLSVLREISPADTSIMKRDNSLKQGAGQLKDSPTVKSSRGLPPEAVVKTISLSLKKIEYEFLNETFSFSPMGMFLLACVVGVIGGIYGIGGGAIIAPFCVAVFHLPVHTIAGATLMGTFLTSIAGIAFYSLLPAKGGLQTSPDWLLGVLFGAGGFAGMYLGARFQKFVPQKIIKILLGLLMFLVAAKYIIQYFR